MVLLFYSHVESLHFRWTFSTNTLRLSSPIFDRPSTSGETVDLALVSTQLYRLHPLDPNLLSRWTPVGRGEREPPRTVTEPEE